MIINSTYWKHILPILVCTFYLFRCEQKVLLTSAADTHGFYAVPDPVPDRNFQAVFRILNIHIGSNPRTRKSELRIRMVN